MGMSEFYGTRDEQRASTTIHRALDLGVTFLDTADMYGPFINEQLVGRAIAGRRDEVHAGHQVRQRPRAEAASGSASTAPRRTSGRPATTRLQRLGVDHIDLYYQHRVDQTVPIEETVGAMKELVEAGKVPTSGSPRRVADTIRRAHAVHPITALQTEYSLFTRDLEDADPPRRVRELGIGLVPYSPLGPRPPHRRDHPRRRSLRARVTAGARQYFPRFQGEALEANLRLVDAVTAIARDKGVHARPAGVGVGARPG